MEMMLYVDYIIFVYNLMIPVAFMFACIVIGSMIGHTVIISADCIWVYICIRSLHTVPCMVAYGRDMWL